MAEVFRAQRCGLLHHRHMSSPRSGLAPYHEWYLVLLPSLIVTYSPVVAECVSEHGKSKCAALNGQCVVERDGYYWVSGFGFIFGIAFLFGYIAPTARKLQGEWNFLPFVSLFR